MSQEYEVIVEGAGETQTKLPWEEVVRSQQARSGSKVRRRANKLDGRTWLRYSISVWSDIKKTQEEVALGHPAMFPVELVTRLLNCYTTDEDKVVFDPFAGIGSAVVAAHRLGKAGIGIDIESKFVEKAKTRLGGVFDETARIAKDTGSVIHCDDARNLLKYLATDSVDMVITSPPYWDILMQKRTADYKEIRHYGDTEADLGKVQHYPDFLRQLKDVFTLVHQVLKCGKYCCVIVMDLRKKDKFYPYHSDVAGLMQDIGFVFEDIIVWDRRREYSNMRPLGYPSRFRINKAHEYILVFQKPLAREQCK